MIKLDGTSLTLESLKRIARDFEQVSIADENIELVDKASMYVKKIVKLGKPVYGINTGFGQLANVIISKKEVNKLQQNLLMSHACGYGEPLAVEVVRGMLTLRINALIKGYSGIRRVVINKLLELLNKNIIPVVYEKGSLGASGDLSPLSHMSLPLIGLGQVYYNGEITPTDITFKKIGIKPIEELYAKEGLSLINGTQAMNAMGALILYDSLKTLKFANLSLAMTMEALGGVLDAFDDRVQQIRGQKGQISVAKEIREFLKGSKYVTVKNGKRVQDAYSLRCVPQVHGATKDALDHILGIVEIEMNAVTDNPLIFADDELAISAGNFHGQSLAIAFDYLAIAISELANISERRTERMVNVNLSNGLPPFLAKNSGLNSGFMIVQYTAASLVSENKVLAHPSSVDSIPSSANQEDHVSMGSMSVRKAKTILDNVMRVIAIEMMTAAQAIDFRKKAQLGEKTEKAYNYIRQEIPFIEADEIMYPHLHKMEAIIKDEKYYKALFEGSVEIE